MGIHRSGEQPAKVWNPAELSVINLQAWTVMDRTNITIWGTYRTETGPAARNFGADVLDYQLLSLPSLGQIIWTLGDEVREGWREYSNPK